jgi:autophagy-related protein 11
VLAISETFDGIAANSQSELQKQESLLNGVDADLDMISKVAVHVEFCSEAVRMAIEAGDPQRVLGDYVSKQKMQTVKDSCAKTHGASLSFNAVPCSLKIALLLPNRYRRAFATI